MIWHYPLYRGVFIMTLIETLSIGRGHGQLPYRKTSHPGDSTG